MATNTRRATTKKAAAKPAPEVEEELEELEEDEVEEAPAKKAAETVTFGVADLCKLINKKRAADGAEGKDVTPRELRTLIRKMAREDSPRVDREIKAGNRSRYDWSGPKDPEVQAIVKAYFGGELEADKQEKLAALKARKAEKAAEAPTKPAKKAAAKKAAPVVEDDEEIDELELDDEE